VSVRIGLFLAVLWAGSADAQVDPDPWFAPDKALHCSVSAGIAGGGYGGAALFTEDRRLRIAIGAGLALTAGIGKELADLAGLGHPSWRDLAWDVAGTGIGLILSWLLDRFVITPLTTTPTISSQLDPSG
jgi:putative lipoprotein